MWTTGRKPGLKPCPVRVTRQGGPLAAFSASGRRHKSPQQHDRDTAARDRLEEIRRSMGNAEK
jgi:hypothetical protein